ncbi:SdrD B-like domain-containing protein [Diaminobutyricimonas aerilata]|uniref:SdrD B-like domain-containing protein n=1 Tax=Diaminobutyricimonas aerilata TaxID=1162967 RepID=UPI001473C729|nr:SdrD B-like domain-containing protein [Diaminobutyricimonas aerilata]
MAAISSTLLVSAGLLAAAPIAASAATIDGAITSVSTDKTSYGYTERVALDFEWAVPDTAEQGDSFALQLPDQLKAVSKATFELPAPDGAAVAKAVWSDKKVEFTLTDYVETHDGVHGTGFLTAQWDHSKITDTTAPLVLDFGGGKVVTVDIGDKPAPPAPCQTNCGPQSPRTERGLYKAGSWTDGEYEGTRDAKNNIHWWVELPGNPQGFNGPITVVDTPNAGMVIECSTLVVQTFPSLVGGTPRTPVDPSRYTLDCNEGGFTLTLDRIGPSEFINVEYKGTITDQRLGAYGNNVKMTIAGTTTEKTVTRKRTAAGGNGDGYQSVSVGDLVWLDTDRDGIQTVGEAGIPGVTVKLTGPEGTAVTDVTGKPVAPVKTNAYGLYSFVNLPILPAGQHYTVTIDRAASADALRGLVPTVAGAGDDRASDSASWTADSTDLTVNQAKDLTLDFGFVTPRVSVGDYVWLDGDRDGRQGEDESGIEGVTLTLTGPDGAAVTDVAGVPVAPVVTDAEGAYVFENLPVLPEGEHYTVSIDREASATALDRLEPTIAGEGDAERDSSLWAESSVDLTDDGDHDPTLDFGFIEARVSVGDYVWLDADRDGRQGDDESGIEGVTLTLTGPDGAAVTDVAGEPVAPVVTDAEGAYVFENLPVLPEGEHYTVSIDREASATALFGVEPTTAGEGDLEGDSSTWTVESGDLPHDGDHDPTLDFGFAALELPTLPLPEEPQPTVTPAVTPAGTHLASTGAEVALPLGAAALLLLLGAAAVLIRRRGVITED